MAKRIKDIQDLIGFYEAAGKSDKEVEIRYAGQVKGLYNGLKNMQGKLEGFVKYDLVAKKAAQEKELVDWIAADPARAKKYGAAPAALEAFLARQKAFGGEDRAPQRRPRRLDHHVPGLQHRPRRGRDPEARQGPRTGLPGTEPAPASSRASSWPSGAMSSPPTGSS